MLDDHFKNKQMTAAIIFLESYQSIEWHHSRSPNKPKEFRQTISPHKLMARVFRTVMEYCWLSLCHEESVYNNSDAFVRHKSKTSVNTWLHFYLMTDSVNHDLNISNLSCPPKFLIGENFKFRIFYINSHKGFDNYICTFQMKMPIFKINETFKNNISQVYKK